MTKKVHKIFATAIFGCALIACKQQESKTENATFRPSIEAANSALGTKKVNSPEGRLVVAIPSDMSKVTSNDHETVHLLAGAFFLSLREVDAAADSTLERSLDKIQSDLESASTYGPPHVIEKSEGLVGDIKYKLLEMVTKEAPSQETYYLTALFLHDGKLLSIQSSGLSAEKEKTRREFNAILASAKIGQATNAIYKFSLSDGPDICFRQVKEKLGGKARVYDIKSSFGVGGLIEPYGKPNGYLTRCSVSYQNQDDPRQLLEIEMNTKSGVFGKPQRVEILFSGKNKDFKLTDFLISLDRIDLGPLKAFMDGQKIALSKEYSSFAWSEISLREPGGNSTQHLIEVEAEGLYRANSLKGSTSAIFTADGKRL